MTTTHNGPDKVLRNERERPCCHNCAKPLRAPAYDTQNCYGDYLTDGFFCTRGCAARFGVRYAEKLGYVGATRATEAKS